MKKAVKIIALISVVCIMMSVLSGCSFIDDLRKGKIIINEDGSLVYKDAEYIKLEKTGELYFNYDYTSEGEIFIGKEEEPILYSFFNGEYCSISKDKALIETFDGDIYCRKDKYESVDDKLKNGFSLERYIYTYEIYNDSPYEYEWEEKVYTLTESDLAKVNEIFETVDPITDGENMIGNSSYYVEIYGCSKDLLFRKYVFDIFYLDNKYYIQKVDDRYNPYVYEVPAKYKSDIERMIKDYVDNYDNY